MTKSAISSQAEIDRTNILEVQLLQITKYSLLCYFKYILARYILRQITTSNKTLKMKQCGDNAVIC